MPPLTRRGSNASDVTVLNLGKAEANDLQTEISKEKELVKPDISQLRIFAFNKTGKNAVRFDRSGSFEAGDMYDVIKRALMMAHGIYLGTQGTAALMKMAEIWIKGNKPSARDGAKEAKAAVEGWQQELRVGNLPPVIVSWAEVKDGHTYSNGTPPESLGGKTVKSLESMTITISGEVSLLVLVGLFIFLYKDTLPICEYSLILDGKLEMFTCSCGTWEG